MLMKDFEALPHLRNRQAIVCSVELPQRCVLCDWHMSEPQDERLMMINETGEAVVCILPCYFCEHCSAVYVEEKKLSHIANLFQMNPYAVVGFLDYSHIPPEKHDLPLGEDPDLLIPLVEFTGVSPLQAAELKL